VTVSVFYIDSVSTLLTLTDHCVIIDHLYSNEFLFSESFRLLSPQHISS